MNIFDLRHVIQLRAPYGRALSHDQSKMMSVYNYQMLFVLLNHTAESLRRDLREIERLQLQLGGIRPVIVTDSPALHEVYRFGYACEYLELPPDIEGASEESLTRVEARLREIVRTYQPRQILTYDGYADPEFLPRSRFVLSCLVEAAIPSRDRIGAEKMPNSKWYVKPPKTPFSPYIILFVILRIRKVGLVETFRRPYRKLLRKWSVFLAKVSWGR